MTRTRRQRIVEMISADEWGFDDLRRELGLTVTVFVEDLRHIERSARASGHRLRVRPASCLGCGFELTKRAFHPPGRCPKCRGRRIQGPWIAIDER